MKTKVALDDTTIAALINALGDPDDLVRKAATEALAKSNSEAGRKELRKSVKHTDATIRKSAINGIGEYGDGIDVPLLVTALQDSDAGVRESAAHALGRMCEERDIPKNILPLDLKM